MTPVEKRIPEFPPLLAAVSRLDAGPAPNPDYANHPLYGEAFPKPGFRVRLRALTRLIPWIVFVAAKACVFGDRIPPVPGQDTGIPGGIAARAGVALRHLPFLSSGVFSQLRRSARALAANESALSQRLREDGIAAGFLPQTQLQALEDATRRPLAELHERLHSRSHPQFEERQKWLDPALYADLYGLVQSVLEDCGALDAASAYLGRKAAVVRALVQMNDARDAKSPGYDGGPATTRGMHLDTTYGIVKCLIYLSEVGPAQGPFCYVLGSHRLKLRNFEGLVRRAVDRAGLCRMDAGTRRLFSALPAVLRKKGSFGGDLLPGSGLAEQLLHAEYRWTSRDGNFAVFDTVGIHRGATVLEGYRLALFAIVG